MKKIRPLRLGEDIIVAKNNYARDALAELEESGDPVRVILRLSEELREAREAEIEAMEISRTVNEKRKKIKDMLQ